MKRLLIPAEYDRFEARFGSRRAIRRHSSAVVRSLAASPAIVTIPLLSLLLGLLLALLLPGA